MRYVLAVAPLAERVCRWFRSRMWYHPHWLWWLCTAPLVEVARHHQVRRLRYGGYQILRYGGLARRPDSAPLAGPALSPPAPREWHCPSGRNSHERRERLAQCRNMCTQLGPSLIITERGRHYGAGGQPPHTFISPMMPSPRIVNALGIPYSVKPPLFLKPTAS